MSKTKKTILVIDDDLAFSNSLISHLKEINFEVLHTDNADDARILLQEHQPDGVSLDMQLNNSLGTELIPDLLEGEFYCVAVSGLITHGVRKMLEKNNILYYDKTASRFHPNIVAQAFASLNFSDTEENEMKGEQTHTVSKKIIDDDILNSIIHQKLQPYKLDTKKVAYKRLVKGIFYTIKPVENQGNSLASIYDNVLNIGYRKTFVGIGRLLDEASKRYPDGFGAVIRQKSDVETTQSNLKITPSGFIDQIVLEIYSDFSEA